MTALLDGDLVRLDNGQHALVQGYPPAGSGTLRDIAVRPWYVDEHSGARRRFASHTAIDRAPFLQALRRAGLRYPPAPPEALPFCVLVARQDIRELKRMSVWEGIASGRIRPRGWTVEELTARLGHPAGLLQVTGSALAGSTTPCDIDVFLPGRTLPRPSAAGRSPRTPPGTAGCCWVSGPTSSPWTSQRTSC